MKERVGTIFATVCAAALGAWLAFMLLDNQIPIEYLREGAFIEPNPARNGSQMLLHWPIRVNRICPATIRRTLTDTLTKETVVSYDRTPSATSVKMGDTYLAKSFALPSSGMPPQVTYSAEACFECNILQMISPLCVKTPTIDFRVQP